MVFVGMLVIDLFMRRAAFRTKYSTSNGCHPAVREGEASDRENIQPVIEITSEFASRTLSPSHDW